MCCKSNMASKVMFIALVLIPVLTAAQNSCDLEIKSTEDRNGDVYFKHLHWTKPTAPVGSVNNGADVSFECSTGFLQSELISKKYTFTCRNGKFNNTYYYRDLLCKSDFHKNNLVQEVSARDLGSRLLKCDDPKWRVYKVKLQNNDGSLKHLYTVCLDRQTMRPKFAFKPRSNTRLQFSISNREEDVWGFDGYGSKADERVALSKGYVRTTQQNRVTNFLSHKYNRGKKFPYYFNRGHLVPYADFSEQEEKSATSQYINAAPQWDVLNKHSWSLVEREARDLLKKNPEQWEIYTGTYGSLLSPKGQINVAPIFDENGKFVKAFLPVPLLYWKIFYNRNNLDASKVFLGVNDPEIQDPALITGKYLVCPPVPDSTTKKSISGDEFKGFTYECKLSDFLTQLRTEGIVK